MNKILVIWLFCLLLIPSLVGMINYALDPNYLFGNNSSLNAYRSRYNERQMKVNYLEINKKIKHDSLILGASRSTYLNTSSFEDESIFNFSVSNMTSKEFIDFTNFFEQKYGAPKNIYMFLDFVGMLLPQDSLKDETVSNINNTEYLLSSLFSLTTLKRSLYSLLWSYQKETGHRAYLSNLDVVKDRVDEETSKEKIKTIADVYYERYSNEDEIYEFSLIYEKNLYEFASKYSASNILVTTSPISDQLLTKIYSDDLLFKNFISWITILCEIFDEVNFMTYKNDFTTNFYLHSWDGNHIYPESFKDNFVAINSENSQYTKILTKENLPAYIIELREKRFNR